VKGTRNVLVKNGKTTPKGVIATLFVNVGDTVTLNDVFAKFRMGADSMKGAIKIALKGAAPADRKWISYDASTEVYTLLAIGANPPTGWTGYLPLDKATEKAAATA
jgi:pyruvate/2-oxoglutarate dehydrogenase complex dihydrolipoamide acyltransferase (E2) component